MRETTNGTFGRRSVLVRSESEAVANDGPCAVLPDDAVVHFRHDYLPALAPILSKRRVHTEARRGPDPDRRRASMAAGTLFTEDFLREGIRRTPEFQALGANAAMAARATVADLFSKIAAPDALNEAQTEDRIVLLILGVLGFAGAYDVQSNLEQ